MASSRPTAVARDSASATKVALRVAGCGSPGLVALGQAVAAGRALGSAVWASGVVRVAGTGLAVGARLS